MTWPDIVALLYIYFDGQLSVPVASEVPNPRPAEWLQIRRVGGTKVPPVRERARVDCIYWAATQPAAMTGALQVRALANALHGTSTLGIPVYTVEEFLGPHQLDDPLTGSPRALATYSLLIRADDAIR